MADYPYSANYARAGLTHRGPYTQIGCRGPSLSLPSPVFPLSPALSCLPVLPSLLPFP
jgi:hypothetical protein